MIHRKIKLGFLPCLVEFVVLENEEEDFLDYNSIEESCTLAATKSNNDGTIYIVIDDASKSGFDLSIISHEIEHAIDFIEDFITQDYSFKSEYRAYLGGYLNKVMSTIILDRGYKIKKIKGVYRWIKDC